MMGRTGISEKQNKAHIKRGTNSKNVMEMAVFGADSLPFYKQPRSRFPVFLYLVDVSSFYK